MPGRHPAICRSRAAGAGRLVASVHSRTEPEPCSPQIDAGDTVEKVEGIESGKLATPFHMLVLRDMGMCIGELWYLEELATESWMHPDALSHSRDRYRLRTRHLHGHADGVLDGPIEAKSIAQLRLARELLAVERRQLIRLRDNGAIGDAVMRRIQRDLDYEELMLHHE